MEIAIVGGGFFGVSTALLLDEHGYNVELFEQSEDIMTSASRTNQWRLHHGYHYPRSESTARTCKDSAAEFRERYPEAVIDTNDHYYCIAKEKTKTTGDEFIEHCDDIGIDYEREHPEVVNRDVIDISVRVPESLIDPYALRARCWGELGESDVNLRFGTRVENVNELSHGYVVVAAYAAANSLFDDRQSLQKEYKYQLVEKPLVSLPDEFDSTSVVVMDGPFMCFDPFGKTGKFLLGNVVEAIHDTTIGSSPDFDKDYRMYVDNGLIREPEFTQIDEFRESAGEFMPGLTEAEHHGSFYTVRTVPSGVEDTDERPTNIDRDGNIFGLYAGKFASAIPASKEILSSIE